MIEGSVFHFVFLLAFTGSTLIVFLTIWKKGRLDFDEQPKKQMMEAEEEFYE